MDNIYRIKAIVFDMDGVIIDSTAEIENFWERWAKKEDVIFNNDVIVKYIHGRTTNETIEQLFSTSLPDVKKQIAISASDFDTAMRPELIEGVLNFLSRLSTLSVRIGLVTSSPKERVSNLLDLNSTYHFFNEIITGDDIKYGKPHPEPYLKIADKLKTAPEDCLVFEDSDSGIESALSAGMYVISINNNKINHKNIVTYTQNFSTLTIDNNQIKSLIEPYIQIDLV